MDRPEKRPTIILDNTNFIFMTNFSGDPERDNYGNPQRQATIIIPTQEQADEMADLGLNVKVTKPKPGKEDEYEPTYFVKALIRYDCKYKPRIFLVSKDKKPVLLNEESVKVLDNVYVLNVKAELSQSWDERNRRWNLYVKTMYVEQDTSSRFPGDPFAADYDIIDPEAYILNKISDLEADFGTELLLDVINKKFSH